MYNLQENIILYRHFQNTHLFGSCEKFTVDIIDEAIIVCSTAYLVTFTLHIGERIGW